VKVNREVDEIRGLQTGVQKAAGGQQDEAISFTPTRSAGTPLPVILIHLLREGIDNRALAFDASPHLPHDPERGVAS
jgi:hypothetical protein